MYLVAMPAATAGRDGLGHVEVVDRLRGALGEAISAPGVDAALRDAHKLWRWRLADVRSRRLGTGRVVFCGDAAIGFLPTAGVGASAALRSAAALADELSRADARLAPLAVEHYVERTEKPIRAHQMDSRRLARAMFIEGGLRARARDRLIRHMPVRLMIGSILTAMRERV
jgi:2-polyprenyl-6-methoxyphenol hydroxylase-like FAD-dependent oxidoreductase